MQLNLSFNITVYANLSSLVNLRNDVALTK